jgi:hypothetical protein
MTETVEQKLARYETVIGLQMEEIDRLRAVVAKMTGTDGAHDVLRRIYLDEAASPSTRVKAAQASINFEKSRLENVPPPMDLTTEPYEPLADVVARQRARCEKMWREDPQFQGLRSGGYLPKGNGGGDDNNSSG